MEFMLNFNLPLFNCSKYRADIRRDESKLKVAQADTGNVIEATIL